jgi:hypothetical protein
MIEYRRKERQVSIHKSIKDLHFYGEKPLMSVEMGGLGKAKIRVRTVYHKAQVGLRNETQHFIPPLKK